MILSNENNNTFNKNTPNSHQKFKTLVFQCNDQAKERNDKNRKLEVFDAVVKFMQRTPNADRFKWTGRQLQKVSWSFAKVGW